MGFLRRYTKSPIERTDFDIDFTDWLAKRSDSIATFAIGSTPELSILDAQLIGGVVRVFVGGGTAGTAYSVAADITTVGGRIKRGVIQIRVQGPTIVTFIDADDGDTFTDANNG